jgi:alkylated DNA nucleotide flippase Atl1
MAMHYFFSDDGNIAIPWYILVNANGTIAQKYAAPPSEMDKLEEEIKKL